MRNALGISTFYVRSKTPHCKRYTPSVAVGAIIPIIFVMNVHGVQFRVPDGPLGDHSLLYCEGKN